MDLNENFRRQLSAWPKKISSVNFTKFNQKIKPKSMYYPASPVRQSCRPQPRQQARSKEPTLSTYRYQPSPTANQQYLTLENLSKIFHIFQKRDKSTDHSDTATDTSTSTTASAKHRSHQHLQRTATQWWKLNRNIESTSILTQNSNEQISTILQQYPEDNLPIITVVSNSTRQINPKYDESEIPMTDFIESFKTLNLSTNRQEPLIMQTRRMRLQSREHRIYPYNHQMNFFQHQRLIRQI